MPPRPRRPGQTRVEVWVEDHDLDFLKRAAKATGNTIFAEWVRTTLRLAAEARLGRIATRRIHQHRNLEGWAAKYLAEQAPDAPDTPESDRDPDAPDAGPGSCAILTPELERIRAHIAEHGTIDKPK